MCSAGPLAIKNVRNGQFGSANGFANSAACNIAETAWGLGDRESAFVLPLAQWEAIMQIVPIQDVYFDDKATEAMGLAFDHACQSLRPMIDAFAVRQRIAKQIINAAKLGERDPLRLQEQAIRVLGLGDCLDVRSNVGRAPRCTSIPVAHVA